MAFWAYESGLAEKLAEKLQQAITAMLLGMDLFNSFQLVCWHWGLFSQGVSQLFKNALAKQK